MIYVQNDIPLKSPHKDQIVVLGAVERILQFTLITNVKIGTYLLYNFLVYYCLFFFAPLHVPN